MTEEKLSHFTKCQYQEVKKNRSNILMLSGTIFPVRVTKVVFRLSELGDGSVKVLTQYCSSQFYL